MHCNQKTTNLNDGWVEHAPVLFEKGVIFFIFQIVELIKVFVLKPVLISLLSGFGESFLDEWCGRGRLLWDDTVLAEDVVPANE